MSRWTIKNIARKPKHSSHVSAHGAFVRIDWPNGVEFGKTFLKDGTEYVRSHNRNVIALISEVRKHAIITERAPC